MNVSEKLSRLSRRDLLQLTGRYGIASVAFAAANVSVGGSIDAFAQAVESTYEKRYAKPAKHTLKFGASGFNARNLLIERAGCLEFARDLEERTEGEIRIEFIGDNRICGQLTCVRETLAGNIDIYAASTQNSADGAPYLNVLDYAYMFPSRASQYYFLYHPESQRILRDPLERLHGLKFLFSHCELRGIQLGGAYAERPTVTLLEEILGTRNRVTGTKLGRLAMELLFLNPVPVAWEKTMSSLQSGAIDGAETWASAVAYAGMSPVVTQSVDLRLFCGTEHTSMSSAVFDALSGDLQDAVMESAYFTQAHIQSANEAALLNTVGFSIPQNPNSIFALNNVRPALLSPYQRRIAEEMCSPEFNPDPWAEWRERLNGWAGGIDTYSEIYRIAREIPVETLAENVEPRRWWRTS